MTTSVYFFEGNTRHRDFVEKLCDTKDRYTIKS
jgi:hypothetical protein